MTIPKYETILISVTDAKKPYAGELMKMEHASHCRDEYYLLWDADTQPCRQIRMFSEEGMPYLDIRKELREGLYETIELLVPGLAKVIEKSFICEHQLIKTEYMRELIAEIEANGQIPGGSFSEKILWLIESDKRGIRAFNAYELYGTYVLCRHPGSYRMREWHTFRFGADFYNENPLSERDNAWIGRDFDAITFLTGHSVREDNQNLFDNPKYQDRLSAGQMLASVQGEYKDGYRLWEGTAEELMAAYKPDPEPEYRFYERLGEDRIAFNPKQAFLCFQQAAFLCEDPSEKERLHERMEKLGVYVPPVAMVIVSYNAKELMEECLKSIRRHCDPEMYSLVVVDNASQDGVREYLKSQKDITVILNEENSGFPAACNQGIKAAMPDEDIFFLNNDTRMTHNALFWLRMGLYESDDTGASGCVANYAGAGQMLELLLPSAENYTAYACEKNILLASPYEEAKILCGFAMLVRRSFIDAYGGMDEAFSPGYYEDTDLSLRIRKYGYRLRICKNSFIYHAGGTSFKKRPDLDEITERNLLLLAQRWGTDFLK